MRDTELRGFFVLVGVRSKTFMAQGDLRRSGGRATIRVRIGDVGAMTARDARASAKRILGQIAEGVDPRPSARPVATVTPSAMAVEKASGAGVTHSGPTLREAWARFLPAHLVRKNRAPSTVAQYHDHLERLLADWLDRPLAELAANPRVVAERHDAMTTQNGPAIANAAMRSFRAVFNHARKTAPQDLAFNPATAVDWNVQERRNTGLGSDDLPAWFEQVARLQNPVRREFHLLSLLSGSRPEALKNVRWADVDLRQRILHIPRPKGGERKAFDIPLSPQMIRSLLRLRRIAAVLYPRTCGDWVFPSDAPSGRLVEHGELRTTLSHWGNDLRQSYRTLGQAAGVAELDMHLLMNHAVPGINAGYITRGKLLRTHLRNQQTRLSRFIHSSALDPTFQPSRACLFWLRAGSQAQLNALLSQSPDESRAQLGPRSAARKLEVQAARCLSQDLPTALLDAPSRRRRMDRPPTRREQLASMLETLRSEATAPGGSSSP